MGEGGVCVCARVGVRREAQLDRMGAIIRSKEMGKK